MTGIQKRSFALAGLLLATGVFALMTTSQAAVRKTEVYLEEKAPASVKGYSMVPGQPGGMRYSYKMDKSTYDVLKPFGIVARQYTDGARLFDAVLITSDTHESFHDPKICFSSQGWTFGDARTEEVDVPGRGKIPFTVVQMIGPMGKAIAAYTYKGPNGFVAEPKRLQMDMFRETLFGRKPMDSTFYRFMPTTPGVGLDDLKNFIKAYMIAAHDSSGGYF